MTDIGGIWNPWSGRNTKPPMDKLIEAASVKPNTCYPDIDAALDSIVPPQGPSLALAGSDGGGPDYEAIIAMAIMQAELSNSEPFGIFQHLIAQTDEWRLFVSSIANRCEDGSAREALEHARKTWRAGLS